MAKIKNSKPKSQSGGYERLFGNAELGRLMSKVQSAVISSGTELENTIQNLAEEQGRVINDIDKFVSQENLNGVYLIPKKAIKKSALVNQGSNEPDFVILVIKGIKRHCYIVELKDGDMFDTKKAASEKLNLLKFQDLISAKLPFTTSVHICCFNQPDRQKIIKGLKNKFDDSEVLTGEEFCKLLEIDYNGIIDNRKGDQKENMEFFIEELLKITEVKEKIESMAT